ncbi:MAG TPA: UDPGP type 1 family protein [Gemmatales bacterium]|nr:UDPGP type 1 family protein [Gemmatales bacterium]
MLSAKQKQQVLHYGQGHLLEMAARGPIDKQASFEQELATLNFAELHRLFEQSRQKETTLDLSRSASPPIIRLADLESDSTARMMGEGALHTGRIAVIMVAGGQGTRLGHDAPKGTYPIGPVTDRSLFQIHAEKVLALSRRYETQIPLLIMTSLENDAATQRFFAEQRWFGLDQDQVIFFMQGMLPALDAVTGQVLLKAPGELALSPNGHGGIIEALHRAGLLDRLESKGITDCFYFQVDNPLVKIADPVFVGHHLIADAQLSLKVLAKLYPLERMGNVVELNGRYRIIEYTELPKELAEETLPNGQLRIWAGSPAIHLFQLKFLQKLGRGEITLPYHIAHKTVSYVDQTGQLVKPDKPNALKFERFVFDALPLAERVVAVETSRKEEFEPLKNAEGEHSPERVRQAMSDHYGGWLKEAGVAVPETHLVEVSPLVAIEARHLEEHETLEGKWVSKPQ